MGATFFCFRARHPRGRINFYIYFLYQLFRLIYNFFVLRAQFNWRYVFSTHNSICEKYDLSIVKYNKGYFLLKLHVGVNFYFELLFESWWMGSERVRRSTKLKTAAKRWMFQPFQWFDDFYSLSGKAGNGRYGQLHKRMSNLYTTIHNHNS